MKPIFKNYTGSPFINNALQTIEVLAELDHVSEITTDTLMELYEKHKIWQIFKRMKSYTMIFTNNGPLLNDKDFGDKIFKEIIEYTLKNFENKGNYQCEVSGLRFDTPFADIYEKVLYEIKYPVKKIKSKDKTINRCWFPLTGALGSDAQALPQAKFNIQIHPICLVVIQFLPFSSLFYRRFKSDKPGIFLLDTINFEFSKEFTQTSVEKILNRIEITSINDKIPNINLLQGDHLINAIKVYSEIEFDHEICTDLNFWSFSNMGVGTKCEIDRIPNKIFKMLYQIYRTNTKCQEDLKSILQKSSARFLECLFESKDYYGLYPRKIQVKKGKKTETVKLEGVSVAFFEAYQKAINNDKLKDYSKYIAYLISEDKELKTSENKLLEKFEPYKEPEYNTLVYSVLLRAAQRGEWSLQNHLEILDRTDETVIKSWIYSIFKMVHFYFYKKAISNECPKPQPTELTPVLSTIIHLIGIDNESKKSIKRLQHQQDYKTFNINRILVRKSQGLDLGKIVSLAYDDYRPRRNDLNKLLRLYFSQAGTNLEFKEEFLTKFENGNNEPFKVYISFVETFQSYYLNKYNNDTSKYENHILKSFPSTSMNFKVWVSDVLEKMNAFSKGIPDYDLSQLESFEEVLFYAPNGEYNPSFSRFAIEFLLNQHFSQSFSNK